MIYICRNSSTTPPNENRAPAPVCSPGFAELGQLSSDDGSLVSENLNETFLLMDLVVVTWTGNTCARVARITVR
jgi:hypothetical protein